MLSANATKLVVILAIGILLLPPAHPRTILLYFLLLSNIDTVGVISPHPGIRRSRPRGGWETRRLLPHILKSETGVPENCPGWGGDHPSYAVTQLVPGAQSPHNKSGYTTVRAQALHKWHQSRTRVNCEKPAESNFPFHNHPKLRFLTGSPRQLEFSLPSNLLTWTPSIQFESCSLIFWSYLSIKHENTWDTIIAYFTFFLHKIKFWLHNSMLTVDAEFHILCRGRVVKNIFIPFLNLCPSGPLTRAPRCAFAILMCRWRWCFQLLPVMKVYLYLPVRSAVLKSPAWCCFAAWVIHGGRLLVPLQLLALGIQLKKSPMCQPSSHMEQCPPIALIYILWVCVKNVWFEGSVRYKSVFYFCISRNIDTALLKTAAAKQKIS